MPDNKNTVLIVGGGAAGMETAGQLARSGFYVTLIEKDQNTGGHVNNWFHLFPDSRDSKEVIEYLEKQIKHDNILVLKGITVKSFEKANGTFIVKTTNDEEKIAHAIVMATGFDLFKSERKEEYGYGIYDDVITNADMEKMFRNDKILRVNGDIPEKIGFVHCVGSRDEKVGNLYCSKLCCVTAVKQAIEVKKHIPSARAFCFYMDMRMGGALYEELYREAQEKYGISFIRGKVSEVAQNINNKLVAKVEDTLAGRPLKMELDMLVLMAGMEMSEYGQKVAAASGLKTGENRFFAPADHHFGSNKSNIEGVFIAGACTAPMNLTETISHARAAAADVVEYLKTRES